MDNDAERYCRSLIILWNNCKFAEIGFWVVMTKIHIFVHFNTVMNIFHVLKMLQLETNDTTGGLLWYIIEEYAIELVIDYITDDTSYNWFS